MPKGFVIYAGNNARKKGWAYRDASGRLIGYLATKSNGDLVAAATADRKKRRYTVAAFNGLRPELDAAAELSRKGNDAFPPNGIAAIGRLTKEEVFDAQGNVQMRSDSNGMFAVVAAKLKKLYTLPDHLVQKFDNVHDDLKDGGTKEDSRANFLAKLKAVPSGELDFFAYSGHGSYNELPSAGLKMEHLGDLVTQIQRIVKSNGTVIFYACCTGTKDGLAQKLSSRLPRMTVFGHLKAGPASTNPNKVKFINNEPQPFLDTLNQEDREKWDAYMKSSADFYARYPFMTFEAMKAEIGIGGVTTPSASAGSTTWVRVHDPVKKGK